MRKIIIGLILGICLTIFLFYSGYGVLPFLMWDWDLKDIHKNCLYYSDKRMKNEASYSKIICIKNGYKY